MLMSPLFISLAKIGMKDSLIGITFAYVSMMIAFPRSWPRVSLTVFPVALEEAAMTEGCTEPRPFSKSFCP